MVGREGIGHFELMVCCDQRDWLASSRYTQLLPVTRSSDHNVSQAIANVLKRGGWIPD